MQVRKYYLKLKTCTLALCRPDKTRQRRIWHKQSALCWSVPLTLTLSPEGRGDCPGTFLDFVISLSLPLAGSGVLLRYHANNQPNHGVDQLSRPQVFNVSFTDRSKLSKRHC
ncbi:hypothetical protein G709_00506 [Escherichia coli HVH 33 (4-2174936)]|nr:hypothetical protein G709_00506 [Escherichia coli HVH 33 (4-2174936)]EQR30153.1 hypothetical protein G783_04765 [Escherichia coli HVH 121 (4-6877826)]EQU18345.1 hypothetical protein G852_04874 [Escherichia coli HVH 200 (4-4449924)]KDG93225.1 hypothetical protein AE25_04223 [Escherichia coli UCI 66]OAC28035.1 hypothetical protein RIKO2351_94c00270 [Escherichia coli]